MTMSAIAKIEWRPCGGEVDKIPLLPRRELLELGGVNNLSNTAYRRRMRPGIYTALAFIKMPRSDDDHASACTSSPHRPVSSLQLIYFAQRAHAISMHSFPLAANAIRHTNVFKPVINDLIELGAVTGRHLYGLAHDSPRICSRPRPHIASGRSDRMTTTSATPRHWKTTSEQSDGPTPQPTALRTQYVLVTALVKMKETAEQFLNKKVNLDRLDSSVIAVYDLAGGTSILDGMAALEGSERGSISIPGDMITARRTASQCRDPQHAGSYVTCSKGQPARIYKARLIKPQGYERIPQCNYPDSVDNAGSASFVFATSPPVACLFLGVILLCPYACGPVHAPAPIYPTALHRSKTMVLHPVDKPTASGNREMTTHGVGEVVALGDGQMDHTVGFGLPTLLELRTSRRRCRQMKFFLMRTVSPAEGDKFEVVWKEEDRATDGRAPGEEESDTEGQMRILLSNIENGRDRTADGTLFGYQIASSARSSFLRFRALNIVDKVFALRLVFYKNRSSHIHITSIRRNNTNLAGPGVLPSMAHHAARRISR
ncbi:hypothetical protein BD779DRAFT_1784808 [Infundibulicybe gibba]|nr:hypothetical protein BD779DRAFT_1784808 [Infundibulicybe gibba]